MLTFFRRIRKGLLGTGATSKYLLYAVGEIALVVVGILIALQINNWNQERLNRLEEQQLRSSRPGEFHLEPLTEPYVKVSLHTALHCLVMERNQTPNVQIDMVLLESVLASILWLPDCLP